MVFTIMGSGDGYSSSESGSERRHNHHNDPIYENQRKYDKKYEESSSSDDARKMRGDEKFREREYDDDWVYGTFDCFEDPKTCLCGCFCVPCQVRSTASKLGEPGCLYWLMHCFVPCISLALLRNKARRKYSIEGDTCEDAVLSWACMHCTNTQLANEVNYREA